MFWLGPDRFCIFSKESDWHEHHFALVFAPLHSRQVLYKCACLPQILPNLYSICVRICLPREARAATSQPTLLPPAAHFAKMCRDVAYFFTVRFGGPLALHISVTWRISQHRRIPPEPGCTLPLTPPAFAPFLNSYALSHTEKQKDTTCTCQPWSYFCGLIFSCL